MKQKLNPKLNVFILSYKLLIVCWSSAVFVGVFGAVEDLLKYLDPQFTDHITLPDAMKLEFILAGKNQEAPGANKKVCFVEHKFLCCVSLHRGGLPSLPGCLAGADQQHAAAAGQQLHPRLDLPQRIFTVFGTCCSLV